jgi:hypothetical protein
MHTQQLSANQQDTTHEVEQGPVSDLACGICERLIEWRERESAHRATTFISKLHALSLVNPAAFWLVCSLMTGDLSQTTKSYEEIGEQGARSKQSVQQETERVIAALQMHFPQLAKALVELRHITAEIPANKFSVKITHTF